ncbi:trypsin-like peptidase domain-containing protein [Streptomyces spinosirectus]|uniref:trypsin-like peptidase domain-containing protein n=1 Tax=Streptomyces spinosirectus TaxID=2906474 RepID=UPI003BF52217
MAGRGPRSGSGHRPGDSGREGRATEPPAPDPALVRIHDLAGRPRGTGFMADHHGTLITSHEAVDGLARLILHAAGDRTCLVTADAVTPLPALDLALVRTEGLGVPPLPLTVRDRVESGTYVRIPAGCWREARVLAETSVTYAATDRFHLLDDALELAIGTDGRDALRLGGGAAGGPVLDPVTGAVVGVLGTALQSGHRDVGFAVTLRTAPSGPLAGLLAENAATVPAYGADLNLAGVLELTATSVGQDGPPGALAGRTGRAGTEVQPVERTATAGEFAAFDRGPAAVLGLVGPPGSGRTTELAALAARRHGGAEPAPTLWLRGADLTDEDTSVADAAGRALARAARIVAASGTAGTSDLGDITPELLADVARTANRPLLLLLDGPEEMPPVLAHRLPEWTRGTADWLRRTGARLVVACRAEYWERAGAEFPQEILHGQGAPGGLPACVRLGDLREDEARIARARYGIPEGALEEPDARHPLTLRLLSEVGAALPDAPHARVDRDEVFSAHLDLMCLRIAVRLAAERGLRGTAVRRLAAKVAGQVHEAARRSLGPGHGELDRKSFEAVFPWGQAPARLGGGTGWASAVLTEGLLVPAGSGYRFAHEELADWIQGMHLDLDEALRALVHRDRGPDADGRLCVPHHRIGPVVEALLLLARRHGTPRLAARLRELTHALDSNPHSWWAARLLTETLLRVPDATPYLPVLRMLADRVVAMRGQGVPKSREGELGCLPGSEASRAAEVPPASEVSPGWEVPSAPVAPPASAVPPGSEVPPTSAVPSAWVSPGWEVPLASVAPAASEVSPGWEVPLAPAVPMAPAIPPGSVAPPGSEVSPGWEVPPALVAQPASEVSPGSVAPPGSEVSPGWEVPSAPAAQSASAVPRTLAVPSAPADLSAPVDPPAPAISPGLEVPSASEVPPDSAVPLAPAIPPGSEVPPSAEVPPSLEVPPTPAIPPSAEVPPTPAIPPAAEVPPTTAIPPALAIPAAPAVPPAFGPRFWTALPLPLGERLGLLRHLLLADGPPQEPGPRFLDAVSRLLAADPTAVQPLLADWFDDDRPLPATPHATVAKAAQALLHTHRRLALDELTEVLVKGAHRRADELLAVLAEDEPSAVCRAVDRWAHDERPARRVAAVAYGLRAAPHVRTEADRELLRYAALALLARPADCTLHGGALALLVRDPRTRARHLPQALRHFTADDPHFPPSALVPALATHPDPVLDAFRERLRRPHAGRALRTLADVTTPTLARRVAALVRDAVERRPETAVDMAAYVDRRLDQGPAARTVLFPLVTGLLDGGPEEVRTALATVLAGPGAPASRLLRRELLDFLLTHEHAPAVLDALLHAAGRHGGDDTRDLVHRTGLLLVRTPDGAARFDRGLVELAREVPGFAARTAGWLADTPQAWAAVVGPSTRRMIENLSGVHVPA